MNHLKKSQFELIFLLFHIADKVQSSGYKTVHLKTTFVQNVTRIRKNCLYADLRIWIIDHWITSCRIYKLQFKKKSSVADILAVLWCWNSTRNKLSPYAS